LARRDRGCHGRDLRRATGTCAPHQDQHQAARPQQPFWWALRTRHPASSLLYFPRATWDHHRRAGNGSQPHDPPKGDLFRDWSLLEQPTSPRRRRRRDRYRTVCRNRCASCLLLSPAASELRTAGLLCTAARALRAGILLRALIDASPFPVLSFRWCGAAVDLG
jgi:hypothetical protein